MYSAIQYWAIRILPTNSEDGLRFMLSAAPQGSGDPVLRTPLETWDKLAADLGSVGTDLKLIEEARKKALEKRKAHTIQNMLLTDEQLRKLGLKHK